MKELVFLKEKAILGFRAWRWDSQNNLLYGQAANLPWQPGVNYAFGCSNHASPALGCHCGFNAWYELEKAIAYSNLKHVIGAIAGSGSLQIHQHGFRSEQAQILAIYDVSDQLSLISKKITCRYRVPVFSAENDFLEFLDDKPVHSPEILRF